MSLLYSEETEGCVQERVELKGWEFEAVHMILELPVGMTEMETERQEEWYPYEGRPEIVLENTEYDIQATLSLLGKGMKQEDTGAAIEAVYELMEETFPKYKRTQVYVSEDGQIIVGWFLMQMEDLGVEHMKAVFAAEGQMALLTMTYRADEIWKWRVVIKHILSSIHKTDEGEYGN